MASVPPPLSLRARLSESNLASNISFPRTPINMASSLLSPLVNFAGLGFPYLLASSRNLRANRSTGDLLDLDVFRAPSPSCTMPYSLPTSSAVELVPFPQALPPQLMRTGLSRSRVATLDPNIDSNNAATPLLVPRSRSRTVVNITTPAPNLSASEHSSSSSSTSSPESRILRIKRTRGQRPLSVAGPAAPAPEQAPPPLASAPMPKLTKHEPINSGSGGTMRLNLESIKRTYSESHVRTPAPVVTRLSVPTVPCLVRKKSGELLKSALKPPPVATPDSLALRMPVPERRTRSSFIGPTSPEPVSPGGCRMRPPCKSAPPTPTSTKFVHFDTQLEHVKLFLSEQKPLAVSRDGSPTEETSDFDTDTSGAERSRRSLAAYSFARRSPSSEEERPRRILSVRVVNARPPAPRNYLPPGMDVQAESFTLTADALDVRVSILVRNIAFNKSVAVRFTFDNWQTTSEVGAKHLESVWTDSLARTANEAPDYDRFVCMLKIGDFGERISEKTLWAVVRYEIPGWRQTWDNNFGANYQVVFEKKEAPIPVGPGPRSEWALKQTNADQMADLRRELQKIVSSRDDPSPPMSSMGGKPFLSSRAASSRADAARSAPGGIPFPTKSRTIPMHSRSYSHQDHSPGSPRTYDSFRALADSHGSPRDREVDEDLARIASRRRVDSDTQMDGGNVHRERPQQPSYFELPVLSPSALSWGFSPPDKKPSAPAARSITDIFAPGRPAPPAPAAGMPASDTEHSSGNITPEQETTTTVPETAPLEDRSRTNSSSSVSSDSIWDAPPTPQETIGGPTVAFPSVAYGSSGMSASLLDSSNLSTPSISSCSTSASATSASSPSDSPSSPSGYPHFALPFALDDSSALLGQQREVKEVYFPATVPADPAPAPADSSNYNIFLNQFCFYTGNGASAEPEAAPRRTQSASSVDDYFGAALRGSPRLAQTSHDDLELMQRCSDVSGRSTPTTPTGQMGGLLTGQSPKDLTTPRAGTPIVCALLASPTMA